MKTRRVALASLVGPALALAASVIVARAADPPAPPQPQGRRVELGFEERIRSENWNNLSDFNDQADDKLKQWRFRTRLWSKFNFDSKTELMVMLNDETKKVTQPDRQFKWDEVIFENLYVDYRFTKRWSVRAGRQNLMRGEGFILFDGTPGDGSRTAYFNALDGAYAVGESKLEFIALSDPHEDQYLPRFNNRHRQLVDWDEQALGVYVTDKSRPATNFELYYFYKTETGDPRGPAKPGFQPDRKLSTLGGRVVKQVGQGFSLTGELAGQWGSQDPDSDIRAWGGYAYVKKLFRGAAKPSLSLGYFAMSGDDPTTTKIEGWDPLFSRWPKWSELYIYTLASEKGVAYWTNLGMWQGEFLIAPAKPLNLRATYYKMRAFHPFPGNPAVYGTGTDRGDMYQVRADFAFPPHWSGHLLYESLTPGDFYVGRDRAWFLRAEVIYAFKHTFPL